MSTPQRTLPAFDPAPGGLARIRAALRSGRTTSVELVERGLERIARYDDVVHAVTALAPDALAEAARRDAERAAGAGGGPLHGIPFVVKDSIDVAGMVSSAGSVALAGNVAVRDAAAVRRLREHGAIVLAKTNMSELAASCGRLGYSSYGGQTANPHDPRRDASGSSSGTAAAVTAGYAPFGLGTDTSGSVRAPAAVCGLAGLRPTTGVVPLDGVVPMALSLDTCGPMARTAADLAVLLDALAGPGPGASGRRRARVGTLPGQFPTGARLGVLTEAFGLDAGVDRCVDAAIGLLAARGATEVPVTLDGLLERLKGEVLEPLEVLEFAGHFEAYAATRAGGVPSGVAELIALSEEAGRPGSGTREVNPARTAAYRRALAARSGFGGPEHRRLTGEVQSALRARVEELLDREGLDALVFPTVGTVAAPLSGERPPAGDPFTAAYLAAATGLPEVTVPVGTDPQGLPVGMSFLGRAHAEATVLRLAHAWQRTARVLLPPPVVLRPAAAQAPPEAGPLLAAAREPSVGSTNSRTRATASRTSGRTTR